MCRAVFPEQDPCSYFDGDELVTFLPPTVTTPTRFQLPTISDEHNACPRPVMPDFDDVDGTIAIPRSDDKQYVGQTN